MRRDVKHLFAATALVGLFLFSMPLVADEPITVSVYPAVAMARGTAQLRVFVERNDLNRMLTWEVDGPQYYRSSTEDLDGAAAPRSWFFEVRDLPEGEYEIRAMVKRNNNSVSSARTKITVLRGTR